MQPGRTAKDLSTHVRYFTFWCGHEGRGAVENGMHGIVFPQQGTVRDTLFMWKLWSHLDSTVADGFEHGEAHLMQLICQFFCRDKSACVHSSRRASGRSAHFSEGISPGEVRHRCFETDRRMEAIPAGLLHAGANNVFPHLCRWAMGDKCWGERRCRGRLKNAGQILKIDSRNLGEPIDGDFLNRMPQRLVLNLLLAATARSGRRGTGLTSERLRNLVDNKGDLQTLSELASNFEGDVPAEIVEVLRSGRMAASRKTNGGFAAPGTSGKRTISNLCLQWRTMRQGWVHVCRPTLPVHHGLGRQRDHRVLRQRVPMT